VRQDALKQRLGLLITQEERTDVDWSLVARLCDQLAEELGSDAPPIVQEYLASFEQRRSDAVFAQAQRSDLVRYLRND
jgi:hypothetical protein